MRSEVPAAKDLLESKKYWLSRFWKGCGVDSGIPITMTGKTRMKGEDLQVSYVIEPRAMGYLEEYQDCLCGQHARLWPQGQLISRSLSDMTQMSGPTQLDLETVSLLRIGKAPCE